MNSTNNQYKTSQIVYGEIVEIDFSSFRDLRNNSAYDEFHIGKANLPTGQVVITDPFLLYNPNPIEKTVTSGSYNVYLYFMRCSMGYRIMYAMIEFDAKIPVTFECALTNETLLTNVVDKKINGLFPVDAGLLSICDFESFKVYDKFFDDFVDTNPEGNIYDDHFATEFAKNSNNPEGSFERGDWINYSIDSINHNILMFSSGLGDGMYPAYWGVDESGKPLKLVIDLKVMDRLKKIREAK